MCLTPALDEIQPYAGGLVRSFLDLTVRSNSVLLSWCGQECYYGWEDEHFPPYNHDPAEQSSKVEGSRAIRGSSLLTLQIVAVGIGAIGVSALIHHQAYIGVWVGGRAPATTNTAEQASKVGSRAIGGPLLLCFEQ